MALRVEELASFEACATLQTQWSELAECANNITVFSTWEWQRTWWKHYGGGNALRIIVVRDGERIVGILPLYWKRILLAPLVAVRELRLLGTGGDTSPDYMGPLIDPNQEAVVATLLAEQLMTTQDRWDVLRMTDIASGKFLDVLIERLHAANATVDTSFVNKIRIVRLPSTWNEYIASLSGDRRGRIGNLRRKVLNRLGGTFEPAVTKAQLPGVIDDLIALHRKRWDSKGENIGSFRGEPYVSFHREAIERCHDRGWIRLYRIEAHGKTVAVLYCYLFRRNVLFFQTGFDPELDRYSLGQVLIGHAIESAIGEGAGIFDMLKGEYDYKNFWSNDVRETLDLVAYNRSIGGRLGRLRNNVGALKRAALRRVRGRSAQTPQRVPREAASVSPPSTSDRGAKRHAPLVAAATSEHSS